MIKRTLCMAALFLIAVSAKKKEVDYVILSGKIENPNSDSLHIRDKSRTTVRSIRLKPDHTFLDTIRLAKGYYSIFDGTEQTQVYLKPGFMIEMTLNTKEFDETIVYKGKGAEENNFLAKKALVEEGFGIRNYYGYYAKLNEKDFLKLTDSMHDVRASLVKQYQKDWDEDFALKEVKVVEFERRTKWMNYESMHGMLLEDRSYRVPADFPDFAEGLDMSDEKLLDVQFYDGLVEGHIYDLTNADKSDTSDYYYRYLGFVNSEIKNPVIREELAYYMGKYRLRNAKNLDLVYGKLKTMVTDPVRIKEIDGKYKKLKKIQKGAVSPGFVMKDINGKEVSLESLKGKLVYIDIWATWCMPCIKEMPALKALEEHYKGNDIQFVSICKSDEMDNWKKMVKEKELGGIQLFATDENEGFFNDYLVNGIPYFILLDKDGKIVAANATRPSSEKLREQIDSLLK